MKDLFKKTAGCFMTLAMVSGIFASGSPITAAAKENDAQNEIPPRMQPDTIIRYIDEDKYVIEQGGELQGNLYNENGLTEEEQKIVDNRMKKVLENCGDMEIIKVLNPLPITDMVVYYDGEGFISEIVNPISMHYTALPRGTTKPNGVYTWGAHNNTLTITDDKVSGTGRITTFSDKIGESDNTLVKGDVATRGDHDNPKHGQTISVTANKKNGGSLTKDMTKRDNGALPDAILDIWKTGVEYWGYTYSSSLSFEDGSYEYTKSK